MGSKFRYRTGDEISGWLLSEGLREAVRSKQLRPESLIQQAGREDWVLASSVPNLFPADPPAEAAVASKEEDAPRNDTRASQRPPETIHHLLHRSVRSTIQMRGHDGADRQTSTVQGVLSGLTADGFMAELPEQSAIVYVPLARVRAVAISTRFPAQGPPRKGETLLIELDSLPDLSELSVGAVAD